LRRFLREIVSNAALDGSMFVFAGEFLRVGTRRWVRRAIGVTFERNGRDSDDGIDGQPLFQIGILRFPLGEALAPAIVVDGDGNVVRVFEGLCAALEGGVIEVPFRRSLLPDQLGKIVPVFVVAFPTAFGSKIKLIPPLELGLRR
jgi:hypothetical protein